MNWEQGLIRKKQVADVSAHLTDFPAINDVKPELMRIFSDEGGKVYACRFSAAALYGTAAANGVIQVVTRHGKAGAPLFRVWSEYGRLDQKTEFPVNTFATGSLVTATNPNAGTGRCDIVRLAIGRRG